MQAFQMPKAITKSINLIMEVGIRTETSHYFRLKSHLTISNVIAEHTHKIVKIITTQISIIPMIKTNGAVQALIASVVSSSLVTPASDVQNENSNEAFLPNTIVEKFAENQLSKHENIKDLKEKVLESLTTNFHTCCIDI